MAVHESSHVVGYLTVFLGLLHCPDLPPPLNFRKKGDWRLFPIAHRPAMCRFTSVNDRLAVLIAVHRGHR